MDKGGDHARRIHRKSRSGCLPCKSRHIRCDEFQPQCRNCARRASSCQYPPSKPPLDKNADTVLGSSWQTAHQAETKDPFLEEATQETYDHSSDVSLRVPLSSFNLSQPDLRLLQHLLFVSHNLETSNSSRLLTWTSQIPAFLELAKSHETVRYSLLSLSASHLGWITRSSDLDNIASRHQTSAYSTLQNAINIFSQENADAVFAASIILSWQAHDWRSWAALIKGETAVVNSIRPWITESIFSAPLAQHLSEVDQAPPLLSMPYRPLPGEARRLRLCIDSLHRAEAFMSTTEEHSQLHKALLDFAQNLQAFPPGPTASEQFRLVYPLRGWLFWLPRSFLEMEKKDFHVIVCFAFYNATVITIKPFFPAVGTVFYKNTQTLAIREIHLYLQSLKSQNLPREQSEVEKLDKALSLVEDCVGIAAEHWYEWSEEETPNQAPDPIEPIPSCL